MTKDIPDFTTDIHMTVPWYLMASFAYYELDEVIMSDAQYDALCELMIEKWETIDHRHKHLVSLGSLKSGTGFDLKDKYPLIVRQSTLSMVNKIKNSSKRKKNKSC